MRIYDQIERRIAIDKGWSGDRKFKLITNQGGSYLLRISPEEKWERLLDSFSKMQWLAEQGIPMCRPVEIGRCDDGVYVIHSWVSGRDAEDVIPSVSLQKQYQYGVDAGRILKTIHTLPAPSGIQPWKIRFGTKLDLKIRRYEECPLKYENGQCFLDYLRNNRNLINDRPQTYQHGDFHSGNMMIDNDSVLTVIDFDRDDYGDPWHEFNRIVWSAQLSPQFASGIVDGYFDEEVPLEFWKTLAYYICYNALSSLPWAIRFGEQEIQVMRRQAKQILSWYDDMNLIIPNWYIKNDR